MGQSALPIPFGWYAVALAHELKPGDVRPLHYFDQELVLFRTEQGVANVVEAYCPHLGAHLGHGGSVDGENIACPFHGWQFSGDGFCQSVPYATNMPPKIDGKQALYSFPTVEYNQTIWTWYHPERIAPTFEVVELDEFTSDDWSEPRFFEWEIDAAIQETAENAADAAHFTYVHRAQNVPIGTVEHDGHRRQANYTSQTPQMDEHGNFDDTGTLWRESYLTTCNSGPGQTWQRFEGLFETMMQGVVTPINSNRLHMRFLFLQRKDMNETQNFMANAMVDEIARQVEQDIPIWQHKIYKPNPTLCDGDGPIFQFRKWFSQFYVEDLPQ